MFPIALDVSKIKVALIGGQGEATKRRIELLNESGAKHVQVFDQHVDVEHLQHFHVVMIVDVDDDAAFAIAKKVRSFGVLVNVEDRMEYCDFFFSSYVRRGDLLLAINTNGKSPALSVRLRKTFEAMFPEVWKERLAELGNQRSQWKKQGMGFKEISDKTNHFVDERGWLPKKLG